MSVTQNLRGLGLRGGLPLLPAVTVLAAVVVLELSYGTPILAALRYLAYEAVYVVIPGVLVFKALASRPGGALRILALGWALGYALEIGAFIATAAAGARPLFFAYPAIVVAVAALIHRRARSGPRSEDEALGKRTAWVLAGVCVAATFYVAVGFFAGPIVPETESVNYFQDSVWTLSIAAEAKNHWPIEEASVAGEPFPYHWFTHIHLAAGSYVTGIDLPTVFFRLFMLPVTIAIVLGATAAGRSLSGRWSVGIVAVCLMLFIGELQMDVTRGVAEYPFIFLGLFFTFMLTSASFIFGLVFFFALLALIGDRVRAPDRPWRAGDWLLLAILSIAALQTKVSIIPLLLGGIVLFIIASRIGRVAVPRGLAGVALVLAGVGALFYALLYQGHSSGLSLDLAAGFETVNRAQGVVAIKQFLSGALPQLEGTALISAPVFAFGLLGLMAAPLIGLPWALRKRIFGAPEGLCAAVLAVGLAHLLFLGGGGSVNHLFGFFYGVAGGCLLSARGLVAAYEGRRSEGWPARRLLPLALTGLVLLATLIVLPLHLFSAQDSRYALWYGGLLLLMAVLFAAGRRVGGSKEMGLVLACAAVMTVGFLDRPADTLSPRLFEAPDAPTTGRRVTPNLYEGMAWIRDETSADAVFAVNNHYTEIGPFEYTYSGLGERRMFLEGWGYTSRAREIGYEAVAEGRVVPFPGRLELNRRAFAGESQALSELVQRGVDYLIVDRINGFGAAIPELRKAGEVVYENRDVLIVKLAGPAARVERHPLLLLLPPGGFLLPSGPMTVARQVAGRHGFVAEQVNYTLGDPLRAWHDVRNRALRAMAKGRPVYAYGESAGGIFSSLLAKKGLAERAVSNGAPSNLLTWDAYVWPYLRNNGLGTRRALSPVFGPTENDILLLDTTKVPATFRMNVRWADRDPQVSFETYEGGHIYGSDYRAILRRAIRFLGAAAG